MGCGDVRLLKTIGSVDFTGQERAALNKLTMPRSGLSEGGSGPGRRSPAAKERRLGVIFAMGMRHNRGGWTVHEDLDAAVDPGR